MTDKLLSEATKNELFDAFTRKMRETEGRHLTRSEMVETRHVCLYAYERLKQLRDEIARPDLGYRPEHVRLEIAEVIGSLQALDLYLQGKGGGMSALGDRNKA